MPLLHAELYIAQDVTDTLKKDREGRGARKWRTAFRRIQQQLLDLEQDSKALELVYPQVCIVCVSLCIERFPISPLIERLQGWPPPLCDCWFEPGAVILVCLP